VLEQSDATGWMGMFCLNLMRIALELAKENKAYEGLANKFFQHYVYVGAAMRRMGGRKYQLWDEEDGFFYDVLRYPDGTFQKFRVRSLVGLIPLYAIDRVESFWIDNFPEFKANVLWMMRNKAHLTQDVCHLIDRDGVRVLVCAIVDRHQTEGLLRRVLDPGRVHVAPRACAACRSSTRRHPFRFGEKTVEYEPAEAESKLKGGNSNWRGPVWFPTSFLMIEALRKLGRAYGDDSRCRRTAATGRASRCGTRRSRSRIG
jgi:hypothetical protein